MRSTERGRDRRASPRLHEMKALIGYRDDKASFKGPYFVVPKEGVSFSVVPTVLLESEVWRAFGINEYRFVTAILVAHARAGGCKNGRLILTHEQLKKWGIKGDRVKPTIDRLVKLNVLEVTHVGGPADPALYRVTFLPHIEELNGNVSYFPPGKDWIEIESEIAKGSRVARVKQHRPPGQKIDFRRSTNAPMPGSKYGPVDETGMLVNEAAQVPENSLESVTLEVSRPAFHAPAAR